jgi:glucose-1-phosphate adenylyltransferase
MMREVMGIINDTKTKQHLKELTFYRSTAVVPFAGRYRMIDFVLSNMANSGIENVGIFTQSNNRSLLDHVDSGKEWDLLRKRDGLFILPPTFRYDQFGQSLGDVDHYNNHMDYLKRSRQKYVLISNSNIVYNMNYEKVLSHYKEKNADIVIIYKKDMGFQDLSRFLTLETDEDCRILDLAVGKEKRISNKVGLEIAFMKKDLFIDILNDCVSRGYRDFTKDGIIKNVMKYKMYGYHHKGYASKMDSILSYYKHSMDLLKPEVYKELFYECGLIYTKVNDEPPVKYMENSNVQNCLVANGCVIQGTVSNSILARGVRIHKNAVVKNSIIMQKCEIKENALVENVILDKEVIISKSRQLRGEINYPIVIEKKAVV